MIHDAIVTFATARKYSKRIDIESALQETLTKNNVKVTDDEYAHLCRDIGRAVEGKEWQPKQLFIEGRE